MTPAMSPSTTPIRPPPPRRPTALQRAFGPGLGGLVFLAVAGVWMAWQAGRVNAVEPIAPLPAVPPSALMGSIATLPDDAETPALRMAAPTPARDAVHAWWDTETLEASR